MLAVWLEMKFSMKEILALYLNRVYFGAGAYGIEAVRVTRADRFDLPRGRDAAMQLVLGGPRAGGWCSLPCTSWCTWTFVNEAKLGTAYCSRLAWRRRHSINMVGHAEQCRGAAMPGGGAAHFE